MSISNINPSITTLDQRQSSLNGPVVIFWDIENCCVPSDVLPENVAGNIRMALRVHPVINGAVTMFSAYGDFNAFTKRLREGCQRTGVKLIDVPNGRKDAADKAILVDMFVFALDNPPPSSIMLISGDVDFAPALHILGQRGYTIILVIPSGVRVSPALSSAGRFVWDWPSVARGKGFVPPAKALIPPCPGLMGCQVNDGVEGQNEEESILYRGISESCYNTRDVSMASQSLSEHSSSSMLKLQNPTTSRSGSLPSGLNEVSTGTLASSEQNELMWVLPGDLNGLKGQLVKLLEFFSGSLPLTRLLAEYQKMYGRPLYVSEYGEVKLVKLLEKMVDAITTEGKGQMKIVCLRNSKLGSVGPPEIILARREKEGKGTKGDNIDKIAGAGGSASSEHNEFTWVLPEDLNSLKGQLVKLLEFFSGSLPLTHLPEEYQKTFGRPLYVTEYKEVKPVELLKKMVDEITIEGKGQMQIVRLYNSTRGPGGVILARWEKNGKWAKEDNIDKMAGAGSASSKNNKLTWVLPGDLNDLKAQLVKLLEFFSCSLPLIRLLEEYQKMYGRPLYVTQYKEVKPAELLEKMVDAITTEGKGQMKIVCLRNSKLGSVGPPEIILARREKEGKGTKGDNIDKIAGAGSASSEHNEFTWVLPEDLNSLKGQLVKLLEFFSGSLPLTHLPEEYQKMYGRPLYVTEYKEVKPVELLKKMVDEITIEGKGQMQIVRLYNSTRGPGGVILARWEKNGKWAKEDNIDKMAGAGSASSKNNKLTWVLPGDLNDLKGQLVKLLEFFSFSLPLVRLLEEYQKMYGRPLYVTQYKEVKPVELLKKMVDEITIEGKGQMQIVRLYNSIRGPGGVILAR